MRRMLAFILLATLSLAAFAPSALGAGAPAAAKPYTFWDVSMVVEQAKLSVVAVVATLSTKGESEAPVRAIGSGIVYRADGYIVTNAHVVEDATKVTVFLPNGQSYEAPSESIWVDLLTDVAVIRLPVGGLTPAKLGDSGAVKAGQLAITIGNPLGLRLGQTVSVGIISGVGRTLGSAFPYLQTDAAVNPGSSGGPLLDAEGRVVGITSAKVVASGVEGLGFAIPIHTVRAIADRLIRDQKIPRAWLGVQLEESQAAEFGLPTEEGLKVTRVNRNGPSAGQLQTGDEVISLNRTAVHTLDDVAAVLEKASPGAGVVVELRRKGELVTKVVMARERPNVADTWSPDDDVLIGFWRNLTTEQARWAIDLARENRQRPVAQWAGDYMQGSGEHAILLQTEFLHIALRYWEAQNSSRKVPPGLLLESLGHSLGQIEIFWQTAAGPTPYEKQYPNTRIWAVQGERSFPCTYGQTPVMMPEVPWMKAQSRWLHSCSFSSEYVGVKERLKVIVESPVVGAVHFEFDMGKLR